MKYILVASSGTEMDSYTYNTEEEAMHALKTATNGFIEEKNEDELECSWVSDYSAYICPIDTSIGEDWYWEIIKVDETSDAIKYLLDELAENKKMLKDDADHDTQLVAKARIVTILNVLEKLDYHIFEEQ